MLKDLEILDEIIQFLESTDWREWCINCYAFDGKRCAQGWIIDKFTDLDPDCMDISTDNLEYLKRHSYILAVSQVGGGWDNLAKVNNKQNPEYNTRNIKSRVMQYLYDQRQLSWKKIKSVA